MKYLAQAAWAWLIDWIVPKWQALRQGLTWASLKAKAVAVYQKVHDRNTGGQ
ncbi:hypothetical protein [Variovorax sp. N23]|uniref:hypothetical protein n=1 Tax=Variovorax sp. N23 TaxID=2980555 RepID=UPI0021C5D227|nr:hypothetical protein [Variovorax sp. N23]MCU4119285.1 hypothetical protein [Variovorax sp. N23]